MIGYNITGNNITNENVIRAELLLDEGDPFTTLNLNKSISKLKARRIFRSVESEVLTGSKENLKLIMNLAHVLIQLKYGKMVITKTIFNLLNLN